jgi:predicted nucleic acid-binding protein
MAKPIMLDTGPLGKIGHPQANPEIVDWLRRALQSGCQIIVPEISDYELRRNLLLENKEPSIRKLDELKEKLSYSPITTPVMLQAARYWADCRQRGRPSCGDEALDGDVILAAQAAAAHAVVATENTKHIGDLVEAKHWKELP